MIGSNPPWAGCESSAWARAARTGLYVGWFVPYEIRFKAGETSKGKLSMVQDKSTGRWVVDGGL